MHFPPSAQSGSAVALQTLALPCTLLLCITSMLRERSIGHQDEKRLVRLYKQHAFVLELVQYFVVLVACGFMTGNTVAAFEARSLVIDFASEDITSAIVRNAIAINVWLSGSALWVLVCMSIIDNWSLPCSLEEVTDSLFRLTRELVRSYIWRHNDKNCQISHCKHFPYDVEQPRPVPSTTASIYTEQSDNESDTKISERSVEEATGTAAPPKPIDSKAEEEIWHTIPLPDTPPPSPPPLKPSKALPCNNNHNNQSPSLTLPPRSDDTLSHPPASRPRYQAQTLTSALRASSNALRSRSRKRSVTFDVEAKSGDGGKAAQRPRERSLVRERVREVEKRVRDEEKEGELAELSQAVSGKACRDGDRRESEGGDGVGDGAGSMFEDAVEVGGEVVEH